MHEILPKTLSPQHLSSFLPSQASGIPDLISGESSSKSKQNHILPDSPPNSCDVTHPANGLMEHRTWMDLEGAFVKRCISTLLEIHFRSCPVAWRHFRRWESRHFRRGPCQITIEECFALHGVFIYVYAVCTQLGDIM